MAFHNAHNFTVNGLNITHANKIIVKNDHDPVSTTLWQHVAAGAIFDSAERFPPAKCHPGTRERMIEKIIRWIESPDPTQRILWLYGPAGSGKSALVHTICERHRDRCGGSFFFARGPTDRGKSFKLFATLSYQLAIQLPSFRTVLNEALQHDPSLPTKSMEAQLSSLIIQPLLRCPAFPGSSPILIIDGLDECADDQGPDTQSDIIMLIAQSLVEHDLPVRFLIASRPESWIRDAFESSPLPGITLSLSLRDDEDEDEDVKKYLTEGFEKIRVAKKKIMGEVGVPWPSAEIVDRFVYEASGQYIYASTLLKFVGKSSRFTNPLEQLRILTTPGPYRALAFSELDRLFVTVLAAYPRWPTMKRVLQGILVHANSTVIEKILGVDRSELTLVLDALSPLIDITLPGPLSRYEQMLEPIYGSLGDGQEEIKVSHLSFREFLQDKTRSGDFHVDIGNVREEMTKTLFGMIHHNIDQNYATEPHITWNIGIATYWHMLHTVAKSIKTTYSIEPIQDPDPHPIRQLIIDTTGRLKLPDHYLEMEHPGCFMADMDVLLIYCESIPSQRSQTSPESGKDPIVLELMDAISLSRIRCIRQLSSKRRFTVTPTLAYLHRYSSFSWHKVDTMFDFGPTVADLLSTFQQHRHIIRRTFSPFAKSYSWGLVGIYDYSLNQGDPWHSRWIRGQWKNQSISFMSDRLYQILHSGNEIPRPIIGSTTIGSYREDYNFGDLTQFFLFVNFSDFQRACNLSILELMIDYSAWNARREHGDPRFIYPALVWFNRQLAIPRILNLLEDHDKELPSKMKLAMNKIFEHHYLPRIHASGIWKNIWDGDRVPERRFVKFVVLPLFQGGSLEEVYDVAEEVQLHAANVRLMAPDDDTTHFHYEVFERSRTPNSTPTIDPQRWHPYFACFHLDALARQMCPRTDGTFLLTNSDRGIYIYFHYIADCLPYAETTQQNLNSFRTIAYLLPNCKSIDCSQDCATEFFHASMEFLKRYDRSILSEEELNEFEKRLQLELLEIVEHTRSRRTRSNV